MDAIKLGVFPAISHSWHDHAESWLVVRAIKAVVNGFKALFGGYSVSLLDNVTLPLMRKCPDAKFADFLRKPISSYNISIPDACRDQVQYLSDKVGKLCKTGRELKVKIAFKAGGLEAIPMYFSQNENSKNLNGKAGRSRVFHDLPGSEKIVCRHLSYAYAKGLFGRGKESFETIDTADKIRAVHVRVKNLPFGNYPHKEGYYFSTDKFPEALEALAAKYWNISNGSEQNFVICTVKHAMALRLKKQGDCMKAVFYEPNDTLRHKTIILSDPAKAKHLNIQDFDYENWEGGCIMNIEPVANWNSSLSKRKLETANQDILAHCEIRIFGDPAWRNLDVSSVCAGHSFHPTIKEALDKPKPEPYRRRRYSTL